MVIVVEEVFLSYEPDQGVVAAERSEQNLLQAE